jgi:hypothetical protein
MRNGRLQRSTVVCVGKGGVVGRERKYIMRDLDVGGKEGG